MVALLVGLLVCLFVCWLLCLLVGEGAKDHLVLLKNTLLALLTKERILCQKHEPNIVEITHLCIMHQQRTQQVHASCV